MVFCSNLKLRTIQTRAFLIIACPLLICGCQAPMSLRTKAVVPVHQSLRPTNNQAAAPAVAQNVLTANNLQSVVWISDSFATAENITNPFSSNLKSHYGDGGVGWIDLYYGDSIDPGVVISETQGWVAQRNTSTVTGVNLSDVRTSDVTTPARMVISVNAQTVTLFYYTQPGGGTFQWWVDNQLPITVNTDSPSPAIATSTIGNLSAATHVFQIQIQSAGSAGIVLDGLDARSGSPGVVLHNLGSAGSDTANWAGVDQNLWKAQLSGLGPTLVVIMLSPNDQYASISVSNQYANLATLIGLIQSVAPSVPIFLAPPPDNGLNRSPTMSAYNVSQEALATSLGIGFIDVLDPMEPFNPNWFNADLLHPNDQGGQLIADIVTQGLNLDYPPPAVSILPSSATIDVTQALPVTITVGGNSSPAPTGTVQLWGGNYASAAVALSAGSASLLIPAGSLFQGNDNLVAMYIPDANSSSTYMSAMGIVTEAVTSPAPAPVFSIPAGTYTTAQSVTITDSATSAAIYYTTDGSIPTTSALPYNGPIAISSSETLQAIATGNGSSTSPVASAAYVINLPAAASPVFSPAAGTYSSAQTVTLSDATPGAAIYYTTDGTQPTISSSRYTGPIAVNSSETLQAIAIASGYSASALASATYSIVPTAAATTTTLSITESGQAVNTATQGSLLTLTATVTTGSGVATTGQINFCDATAAFCSDIHLLGTAQLSSTGTAVMTMRAAPGQHSYKAVFPGTPNGQTSLASSSSSPWSLAVQALPITTTSSLSVSGTNPFTLTCTVAGHALNGIAGPTGTITFTDQATNSVLGTAALGSAVQAPSSLPHVDYTTGSNPAAVVYGDFNGDGVQDLVIANQGSNSVSILLGNPDGTFQPQSTYSFSSYPLGIVVGDFNGDNKLDLAIPNYGANSVTILLGNGDGTFNAVATSPATGAGPAGIVAGDFNRDGHLDLAVTNSGAGTVSVLLGNGDGTFQGQTIYTVGTQPMAIVSGWFSGTGQPLDLVVANYGGGTLSFLAGNGDGTFQNQQVLTNGISSNPTVTAADFNGDGNLDIGAAGSGWATVLLGNGNGTFQYSPLLVTQTGINAGGVTVGDLNGDAVPDVAISANNGSTVLVLYGHGDGTMTVGSSYPVGTNPTGIVAADFNGDGLADLAVADAVDGKVSILLDPVSESATATIPNVIVNAGTTSTHPLQCSYPGDANHTAGVSNTVSETITATSPVIAVSPVSIRYGTASATLRASIQYAGPVAPTGLVGFQVDSGSSLTASCTGAASPLACTASYGTAMLPAGSHTITATVASDANYFASSQTGTLTVTAATPVLVVSPVSIRYGTASAPLRAYVEYTGAIAPTGAVSFQVDSGSALAASCTGTASPLICTASYGTGTLPGGSHTITVSVASDANYSAASQTGTLTVTPASPILVVSPVSIKYGTASATLRTYVQYAGAKAPTGAVSLQVDSGSALAASCTGTASPVICTASYGTGTLTAGSHTITASVASDANYSAASLTGTLTVTPASPVLVVSAVSIHYGTASATLRVSVQYAGGMAPTGAVSFQVDSGSALIPSCAGTASPLVCTASYGTGTLATGSHTITATVASDANYSASSQTGTLTVTAASPVLVVSPISIRYGTASTTLRAYVEYAGAKAPTGAVTFQVDSGSSLTPSCTAALPMVCTASYGTGTLTAGSHTITVSVASDSNYSAASLTGALTVTAASPVLVVSPISIRYGTASTPLRVSVQYAGALSPSGAVSFAVDSGSPLIASCTGTASPLTCTASYGTGTLATGSHTIMATVASDANYSASSQSGALTVTAASPVLVVSAVSIRYGTASATLHAYVEFGGALAPTGAVTFKVDSGSLLTASCTGTASPVICMASYGTGTLQAGNHTITASVASDANYTASSQTGTLTVTAASPILVVSPVSIRSGTASATLRAYLEYTGALAPTGAVSFKVDSGSSLTATCSGTASPLICTASYGTATLVIGSHTITASVASDANYTASSQTGTLTVTQ